MAGAGGMEAAGPLMAGWLFKKGHVEVAEGAAGASGTSRGPSRWHRRYCVLLPDSLVYFAAQPQPQPQSQSHSGEGLPQPRGSIPLAGAGLFVARHSRFGPRYFELHVPALEKK
jgi:hypothetical protein